MITAPFLQWSLSVAFTATFVYAVLGALSRKALTEKIAYVFHTLMSVAMFTMVWRSPPAHATERCFHSGHDVVSDAYRRPRQGEERWGPLRETSRRSPQSALPRGDDGGDGPNGDRDAQHGRHVLDDNSHLHELHGLHAGNGHVGRGGHADDDTALGILRFNPLLHRVRHRRALLPRERSRGGNRRRPARHPAAV